MLAVLSALYWILLWLFTPLATFPTSSKLSSREDSSVVLPWSFSYLLTILSLLPSSVVPPPLTSLLTLGSSGPSWVFPRHSTCDVSPMEFLLPAPTLFLFSVISVKTDTTQLQSSGSETWPFVSPPFLSTTVPYVTRFCPFYLQIILTAIHFPMICHGPSLLQLSRQLQ